MLASATRNPEYPFSQAPFLGSSAINAFETVTLGYYDQNIQAPKQGLWHLEKYGFPNS